MLKAQSTKTNKYVAIKCMKAHFYNIDQVRFPIFISFLASIFTIFCCYAKEKAI